jgi:hypothetical protein
MHQLGTDWVEVAVTKPESDSGPASEQFLGFERTLTEVATSENLLVLSGLGTSRSVKDQDDKPLAPTMTDLWTAVKKATGETFEKVKNRVRYPVDAGDNIELLLSRCQLKQSLRPSQTIRRFIRDAEAAIVSKCDFVKDGTELPTHEGFLRKVARRSTRLPRMKLFTLNYDLCFEIAASHNRFIVVDGFSHTHPQEFDGSHFLYDFVRREPGKETPDFVPNVLHLYKMHGSLDWERANDQVRRVAKPSRPLIIYPRSSKFELSYEQPFLELMSQFQIALRQPNTGLMVIGYGFNDDHISQPVLAAMKSNVSLKALIVDPTLEKSGNPVVKEVAQLVTAGDTRLALVNGSFEDLAQVLPDLVAATEQERHQERIRGQGRTK